LSLFSQFPSFTASGSNSAFLTSASVQNEPASVLVVNTALRAGWRFDPARQKGDEHF
jgi:hypothetical protein